jgi:uncharacterized integral membrane protein (TIGR00698 family)
LAVMPPAGYSNWSDYFRAILPGVVLCTLFGMVAMLIDHVITSPSLFFINYVVLAVIFGLMINNIITLPRVMNPGIGFSAKTFLYLGIILLGARLNLLDIFSVGLSALLMVAVSISVSIGICGWAMGKINRNKRWGHLVGAGIGVCGVSAIIALAPVIKAREREVFASIGAVLINDIILLFLIPTLAVSLGWSDMMVGFIAGVAPSNTAQCIAIGHAFSDGAGAITTIVKSARNTLIPLVILVMAYLYTKNGMPVGEKLKIGMLWEKFPKFVIGFLVAAMLNTLGLLPAEILNAAGTLSVYFFVVCFVGIGAGINIRELGKSDLSAILLGVLMAVIVGLYAFLYSTFLLKL